MKEQENKYIPLTSKKIVKGKEKVVCLNYGTEKCQIHKDYYKVDKRLFEAILEQLNAFEEVYTEPEIKL